MIENKVHAKMLIDLTQSDVRAVFDYDESNGWLIRKKDENGRPYNKPAGITPICSGYGRLRVNGKMYLAHRIIWLWYYGSWPIFEINHIDRDRMNNRISNLEDVRRVQNQHNKGEYKNNTTGYKGVSWSKRDNKFYAQIKNNAKTFFLGYFNTPEEAHYAYKLAKIQYHPTSPDAKKYAEELGIEIS